MNAGYMRNREVSRDVRNGGFGGIGRKRADAPI